MPRTIRSKNLDLIRWLSYGHERAAKMLAHVTNGTYLSKMATGEMEIGDRKARSIEKAAGLPSAWMDRDNVAVLSMSPTEFELHQLVASMPEETQAALLKVLSSSRR